MGQGLDWDTVRTEVSMDLYVVPYYEASTDAAGDKGVNGLFSWSVNVSSFSLVELC